MFHCFFKNIVVKNIDKTMDIENQEKKSSIKDLLKKGSKMPLIILVSIFVTIGLILSGVLLFKNIELELFNERCYHLEENMTTVVEKIEIIINDNWNYIDSTEVLLKKKQLNSSSDVKEALNDISNDLSLDNSYLCFEESPILSKQSFT